MGWQNNITPMWILKLAKSSRVSTRLMKCCQIRSYASSMTKRGFNSSRWCIISTRDLMILARVVQEGRVITRKRTQRSGKNKEPATLATIILPVCMKIIKSSGKNKKKRGNREKRRTKNSIGKVLRKKQRGKSHDSVRSFTIITKPHFRKTLNLELKTLIRNRFGNSCTRKKVASLSGRKTQFSIRERADKASLVLRVPS